MVKLDSNGTNPSMLKELYSRELLDYVAMDIKSSLEHYNETAGVSVNIADIKESTQVIRTSGTPYEFRTTVVPGLHDLDKIEEIGKWLEGSEHYILQPFSPEGSTIDRSYADKKPFDDKALKAMADAAKPYFKKVELREYY